MTPKDFEIFKPWLVSHLKFGPVTVTFTKKDGTERVMNCTLSEELIPKVETLHVTGTTNPNDPLIKKATAEQTPEGLPKGKPKAERKVNEDILSVYDLDAKAWRSFRWESVKRVEFSIA